MNLKESFDLPSKNLFEVFQDSVEEHRDNTALVFYNEEISYDELGQMVDSFSCGLKRLGIEKGDRVAIFLPNSPQFVISFLSSIKVGAVPVPLNPLYTSSELRGLLEDSGAEIIVTLKKFLPVVRRASKDVQIILADLSSSLPSLLEFPYKIQTIGGRLMSLLDNGSVVGFEELLSETGACEPDIGDLAVLMYTSGTTGDPKGVPLSHKNLVSNLFQISQHIEGALDKGKEVVFGVLPFFHVYGLTFVLNHSLKEGYTLVLLPKFQTKTACKVIKNRNITILPGVPSLFKALLEIGDKSFCDFSSLKFLGSGASPCSPELIERAEKAMNSPLVEAYGLSESSPITHMNPPLGNRKAGSIGVLFPGTKARVVDEGGEIVKVGEVGELLIKGPQVFSGYWGGVKKRVLEDGWLHTGDTVEVDEDGYFYIKGRVDDMINVRGEKVWPREIEEVLIECPGVEDVAVIGIEDDYYGQAPQAFVVGKNIAKEDVLDFCRKHLIEYKVPKMIEFVSSIPKNHLGKTTHYTLKKED